jgi:hypothetical protein
MPLNENRTTFTFNHADQVDEYGASVGNFDIVQTNFDSRAEQNLTDINNIKTTLASETVGDSGAHNIKSAGIAGILSGAADTVYAMLSALKGYVDTAQMGQIPDGSLGDVKLSNTAGQIKDTVTTHLAEYANGHQVGAGTKYGYFSVLAERTTLNYHAYEDLGILNTTDTNLGYASFDAKPTMNNALDQSHLVGYQARPVYNGSGNLTNYMHGYDTDMEHSGSGAIAQAAGVYIRDVKGTGIITNNYGIYINAMLRGANNWAIYSAGGNNYFAGNIRTAGALESVSLTNNLTYLGGWKYITNGYGSVKYFNGSDLIEHVANTGLAGGAATLISSYSIDMATGNLRTLKNIEKTVAMADMNNLYYSSGWKYRANGYGYGTYETAGKQYFARAINNAGGAGAVATLVNAMTIDLSNGYVGINNSDPQGYFDINSDNIRVRTAKTPASAGAAGVAGTICWDANYMYVCVATNTWKRVAIATW